MFTHRLQRKHRLSRKQAHNLIVTMTRFSGHFANLEQGYPVSSESEIRAWFSRNGYTFDDVVEECRDPERAIPLVENILGSTFIMFGGADTETIITSSYQAAYEAARDHLERAVEDASFSELESAIVRGIASIEAFIHYQASKWNETNQGQKLVDSKGNKVSFNDKIDDWIPILSGGEKLDKGNRHWQDFNRLRAIRDAITVHPKTSGHTVKYSGLAELINIFRTGIAGILIDLHILFRHWVPSTIIRGYFAPEVEVAEIGK